MSRKPRGRAPGLVLGVAAALTSWVHSARGQGAEPPDAGPRPRIFLACPQLCFDDYLRQALSYFDFVREPALADITLVIVRQNAGSGGERFSVTPTPAVSRFNHLQVAARSFSAAPGAPARIAREQLLQVVLRSLQAELIGTAHEAAFELKLATRDGARLSALTDPWNYWVIAPELLGDASGGSGFYAAQLTAGTTVRRITDLSKLRLRGTYSRAVDGYRLEDGSRVNGDVYAWEGRAMYAHSLGQRWALGGVLSGRGSESENIEGHVHTGPLLEFNVFPYVQNASQQLRIVYQAGVWANWYTERNQAGHLRELRPYHALSVIADVNQTWGSVQWVNQANMFPAEPSLYRLSTGASIAIRIFKGLAFSLEGQASYVRDLVNLRGRPITDLELLLATAQQPTDYLLSVRYGLTYTFGSVYNTIVNPRFGRVDFEED